MTTLSSPLRVDWLYAPWIVGYHLVALLALLPYFFSWTAVAVCLISYLILSIFGINICYHRLLTHRGFECPRWLEYTWAIFGVWCVQDSPVRWVAVHRRHHEYSDEEPDPHTPLRSFLWAHVGWLLVKNPDLERLNVYSRYAKDLLRHPFYRALEFQPLQLVIILASWALYFGGGYLASLSMGGSQAEAVQFGAGLLVWGVFVRTVCVWHATWAVNSVSHMWGYKNYETGEDSRNNAFVALISHGEGWHNNHHADARAARHGHLWYEIDTTYWMLLLLRRLGLVWNIEQPRIRPAPARAVVTRPDDELISPHSKM